MINIRSAVAATAAFLIISGAAYAASAPLNGMKSVKLPWQGTPTASYDSVHNVGSSSAPQARFALTNSNTVVTDSVTGLKWQSYYPTAPTTKYTWANAKAYCASLVLGGFPAGSWRLPTAKELNSIVDFTKSYPSIDTAYFWAQSDAFYWSSTIYAPYNEYAHVVQFSDGNENGTDQADPYYARCVK